MKTEMLVDGKIDMCAICQDAEWHQAKSIQAAIAAGLMPSDAAAYVAAYFELAAETHDQVQGVRGPRDMRFEDHLSDAQWERLQLVVR